MTMKKCPVCECNSSEELTQHVHMCDECGHIFRLQKKYGSELHTTNNPIQLMFELLKKPIITLTFPSLVLHGLTIKKDVFDDTTITQYFNQMSLVILAMQVRVDIVEQHNYWDNGVCMTTIKFKRGKV